MQYTRRRLLSTLVLAGVALLIMGASSQITTGVTSSVTSSITTRTTTNVVSKTTSSIKSRMTSSTASGVTSSPRNNATTSVISRGTCSQVVLSPNAEELAKIIKFDRQVLITVKKETQEHIQRLIGYDENDYQIMAPGISITVPKEKTDVVLASLRKKLIPLNYMPFVVEMNTGLKVNKIGVIKGTDQYEILRIMHTDGEEYDISHQDVIDRLKEWEKIASFDIIGADSYWVEIEFKMLPKDITSFAKEVKEFSPDTVEQGPGTMEGLIKEIKRTKRVLLLWE